MYVKAIIILCLIVGILLLCLFVRGRSNGSGISDDSDIVDKLKERIDDASKIYRESGEATSDIKRHNREAGTGLDEALEILRRAKDRQDT